MCLFVCVGRCGGKFLTEKGQQCTYVEIDIILAKLSEKHTLYVFVPVYMFLGVQQ